VSGRAAAALALMLAGPASAQDTGTLVRGEVARSATDATPPQLVVRLDDGAEVEVNLGAAARAVFAPGLWTFDTPPLLADVRPGMRVELVWDPERVDRVRVLAVPPGTRAGVPVEVPVEGWGGPRPAAEAAPGARRVLYGVLVRAERDAVTVEVEGSRYRWPTAKRGLAQGLPRGARIRLEVEADADGRPTAVTRVF
jgi:hypothetical protein